MSLFHGRWIIATLMILAGAAALGAVSALAVDRPVLVPQPGDGPPPGFTHDDAPAGSAAGIASLVDLGRRAAEAEESRKAFLSSAAATDERVASRSAYADTSGDQAAALIAGDFAELLTAGLFDTAKLAEGALTVRFLDDYALRVDRPGTARDVLIDSPLPLRTKNDQGVDAPVDLSLERRAKGFVAANPIVDVSLPDRLEDGVDVGGLRAFPDARGHGASAARLGGSDRVDGVLYHEATIDTDVLLVPAPTGLETAWLLRSPQAPGEQRLRFALPNGGELQPAPDGGIDLVRGEDRLGRVLPPYAVDAQGEDVDVSYDIDGATLVVRVDHREEDVAYPILVDPVIEDWLGPTLSNSWYHGYGYDGLSQWFWQSNQAAYGQPYAPRTDCYAPVSCYAPAGMPAPPYGRGLYVYVFPSPQQVPGGTFGQWVYDPPGNTTQVTQATFGPNFSQRRSAGQNPYFFLGIWASGINDWTALTSWPTIDLAANYTTLNAGSNHPNSGNNTVSVGYFSPSTVALPAWRDFGVGGARMTLTDPENPTVTAVGQTGPSGWTASGSFTVAPTGEDPGLGVKSLALSVPRSGGTATQTRTHACTGRRANPCPASWTLPSGAATAFSYTTNDVDPSAAGNQPMPEGVNTVSIVARDVLDKASTAGTAAVKVDRGSPSLTLSGGLWDRREPDPPPSEGESLADGTHTLSVDAADPAAGPAPQGTRAGVVRIEIKIDGQSVEVDEGACAAGNCSRTAEWDFDTEEHDPGRHTVDVVATDGAGNEATEQFTVFVAEPQPAAPPLPDNEIVPIGEATEFLYTGPDPIQTGVEPGTIEPRRAAVVRGAVRSASGNPVAGVDISAPGHSEYGSTTTDTNGEFSFAVNGGSQLTVRLEKAGNLPVDRQVDVPWQDYVWIDDVVLTELDPNATEIDLSSPLSPLQVARGSVETDDDGTRQATLIFPPDTSAEMVMPNGTEIPLDELTVRATEYTVGASGPDAMPAPLPANSAYTYAAEFSVDEAMAAGASEVRFSQPLASYTENFLDFPVGEAVPAGYYDREQDAWVPAPDGRVVEVIAESGGAAVLDVTGSGDPATPSELGELGVTDDELAELADLYAPGDSLWRVQVDHFTPWDYNWPFWIPEDWTGPGGRLGPRDLDDSCTSGGSVIECENQTLGEDLPLTGSEVELHYRSDRVSGRRVARVVNIPLTGSSVSEGMAAVRLSVQIAGRQFSHTFAPEPNLSYTYEWDGRDAFGRRVNGGHDARIEIIYEYDSTLYGTPSTPPSGSSFARTPDVNLSGPQARYTKEYWQYLEVTLGGYERSPDDLGGWTLSNHHHYDSTGRVLDRGDGQRRRAYNVGMVAEVAAGVPSGGVTLMGAPPNGLTQNETVLDSPNGVAVAADGSVYIADAGNAVIRKLEADGGGTLETIAGSEEARREFGDAGGDGGPAVDAEFASIQGLDIGPDGSLYVADLHRIRRIAPDGVITTFAGREDDIEEDRFGGDDGPATDAFFDEPAGLDVAPDGSLYVADVYNHRIRRIGSDGVVVTVAGSGPFGWDGGGFSGDGGSAIDARLSEPVDVELAASGDVYVSDLGNNRVRRIAADGRIDTVAGDGDWGTPSYGENALESSISPRGLAIDRDGRLLVANEQAIARLDPDGVVRKAAGVACTDFPCATDSGDGAPADRAELGCPQGLAIGHDVDLYLSDPCLGVVRRVRSSLPGFEATDLMVPSPDAREIYQFDQRGRHLNTRDAATGAVLYTFAYDGQGRLVSFEDGDGLETEIERGLGGKPTAIVTPFGQRTEVERRLDGYLASVTNPAAEETAFDYAADGLLTSMITPEGHETTFEYDADGRLTLDDDAAGGFKELSRVERPGGATVMLETALERTSSYEVDRLSDNSVIRRQTDPAGLERTVADSGGVTTAEEPDGTTRRSVHGGDPRFGAQAPLSPFTEITTPGGRLAQRQASREVDLADPDDPLSVEEITERVSVNFAETTAEFDAAEGVLEVETPEGRTVTTEVDDKRRPLSVTTPGIEPIVHSRDVFGRIESTTQGARTTDFDYDPLGRLELVTDALDREHGFEYDDADRVVEETLPDGREIGFGYDDDGNLASVTPPSRPAHQFDHTPLGQTDAYTPPDLGPGPQPTTFEWSDDRELTEIAKPGGRVVEFDYDAGGRLDTVAHSGGETSFDYDSGTGNLASASAAGGEQTTFAWDGFLPLGETASGTVDGEVSRTFDDRFQIASESVDGGHTVPYYYDDDGLMIQAGEVILYHDPDNGLLASAEQGVVTTAIDRDAFGDPERVSSQAWPNVLYEEEYERDDLGRIVEKVERRGVQSTLYEYGYDLGGRLETVTVDGLLAATYSYDANGNRVGVERAGEFPVVGAYDAQDRLTSYDGTTYSHDASGQLESKTEGSDTTSYDYDDLGSLRGVTLPGGEEIDYAIDASGRRAAKKVDGVLEQGFLYGLGLGPVAELDASGDLRSRFVYGTRANVPEYMVRGGNTYRLLTDQTGSPRAVVDVSTGAVVQEMDFDEFGRVTRDTNPGFQPFGFAGGLYDSDTGLVRFGARDYDPETGRWTAKDPIGFAGGDANLYGYVLGDPVNWTDPTGRFPGLPSFSEVSEAAAGALDALTFGGASALFGVSNACWGSAYDVGGWGSFAIPVVGAVGRVGRVARLRPHADALGPHTSFKRDPFSGIVNGYEEYDGAGRAVKRFRGTGRPGHGGVGPPVVYTPAKPGGRPKSPRHPELDEFPNGY